MLYSTKTAEQKRIDLRETLKQGGAQQFPGAFTPLSAKLIQEKGFEGVYLSGAVMANELGLPDIGLTTLSEVATQAAQVASATDLPVLVDADTGFGEPMNAARTVQALEDAGVAGLHIEDQVNPKRCGHLARSPRTATTRPPRRPRPRSTTCIWSPTETRTSPSASPTRRSTPSRARSPSPRRCRCGRSGRCTRTSPTSS